MANEIPTKLGLPFVELDALHWAAGWRVLSQTDPNEFVRRVRVATSAEAWVIDGAVRGLILNRATHLVWLPVRDFNSEWFVTAEVMATR